MLLFVVSFSAIVVTWNSSLRVSSEVVAQIAQSVGVSAELVDPALTACRSSESGSSPKSGEGSPSHQEEVGVSAAAAGDAFDHLDTGVDALDQIGAHGPAAVSAGATWAKTQLCAISPQSKNAPSRVVEGFLFAAKYHLPMLGLDVLPHYRVSNPALAYWLEFMRLLSWVMIPLLIAVGVGRLLPKRIVS